MELPEQTTMTFMLNKAGSATCVGGQRVRQGDCLLTMTMLQDVSGVCYVDLVTTFWDTQETISISFKGASTT
jgi:hypothetical protein